MPIAWDRAVPLDIGGGTLKVVDLDGLLQLKFRAGGPQDLLDAARLVLLHPETEARARELATAYRVLDRFETWLRDPRIRGAGPRGSRSASVGRPCERGRSAADGRQGTSVALADIDLTPSAAPPCFHETR